MSKSLVINKIEIEVKKITSGFFFIQEVKTILKTAHTIKIRLDVSEECFIQIYRNTQKNLISYVTVVGRNRIFGRDCYDGGSGIDILMITRIVTTFLQKVQEK